MPLVTITLPVPEPARLLQTFNVICVHRSKTGPKGVFEEITTPQTRLPISADRVTYVYDDLNGDASYWYCESFLNTVTQAESARSEPVPGDGMANALPMSIEQLKDVYLSGLPLSTPSGQAIKDSVFEFYLRTAISYIEQYANIAIFQRIVQGEVHDYYRAPRTRPYMSLKPNLSPVQSVQALRLNLPGAAQPYAFPSNWVSLNKDTGRITVYPQAGAFAFPMLTYGGYAQGVWGTDMIPNGLQIDYVAGFEPGQVPFDIMDAIGRMAACGPLAIAGDLIGGVGLSGFSLSLDGLSQSVSTNKGQGGVFAGRIAQYKDDLTRSLAQIRRNYRGMLLTAV